mgnify:CR=1 FL=1
MNNLNTPIHEAVRQAVARGTALSRAEVRALHEKSELAIRLFKISIFVLLGIFVLSLWLGLGLLDPITQVELPFSVPPGVLLGIGLASLVLIFIVPVRKIRRHYQYLELLEGLEPGPKKSRASEAGKDYIEQARKDGRTFTRAEIEVLEASRDLNEEP